ncbi:MAG: peptidylprolyl isomerase [Nonlabens sp.]
MKKILSLSAAIILMMSFSSCEDEYPDLKDGLYAEINTTKGTMIAELYTEGAPMTVANFVALAEGDHPQVLDTLKGKPFYDGLIFHRVIKDFMIQGGDFTGTGSGSVGYKFPQEVSDSLKHDEKGVLSMANAGPNTNGSQFFIMHKATPSLDMKYNVFGKVIEGLAVIDTIATTKTTRDRPDEEVKMTNVKIIRKGKAARKFDAVEIFKEEVKKAELVVEEAKRNAQSLRDVKVAEFLKYKPEAVPAAANKEVKLYFLEKGDGHTPEAGSKVQVNYSGYLNTGSMFDSTNLDLAKKFDAVNMRKEAMGAYRPIPFEYTPDGQSTVVGFRDALLSMNKGDKAVAFIPAHLAYGERGNSIIPPNSDMIFELEILDN